MVKRSLGAWLFLLIICMSGSAGYSQMYSLWTDETMTACEYFTQAPYVQYTVCLMLEPGPTGVIGAEYMITIPADHIVQVATPSPLISVSTGDPVGAPGIGIGFSSCQYERFVLYNFLILPPTITSGWVKVEPHAEFEKPVVYECPGDRAQLDAFVYCWFGFNDMNTATEETSWGTIKALFDE